MKVELICKTCGKQEMVFPSQLKDYCSSNCRSQANTVNVVCEVCGKEHRISKTRLGKYHTCSVSCRGKRSANLLDKKIAINCGYCDKPFKVKKNQITRRNYCSKVCQAEAYKDRYKGEQNPNYRGVTMVDGYPIHHSIKHRRRTCVHREVVLEFLNLERLPKGYQVHHRDCDKTNNLPENLVLLTNSDHRWLHKNFGNVTLWAICHGKISAETVANWCTLPEKALHLLSLNLPQQQAVFKSDELLENPEEDNQQPSYPNANLIG